MDETIDDVPDEGSVSDRANGFRFPNSLQAQVREEYDKNFSRAAKYATDLHAAAIAGNAVRELSEGEAADDADGGSAGDAGGDTDSSAEDAESSAGSAAGESAEDSGVGGSAEDAEQPTESAGEGSADGSDDDSSAEDAEQFEKSATDESAEDSGTDSPTDDAGNSAGGGDSGEDSDAKAVLGDNY